MKFGPRPWTIAIALGSVAIVTLYLVIVSDQGNSPFAWFVVSVLVAGALPIVGLIKPRMRKVCFGISAGLLTVLGILAALSIGVLLLPIAAIGWVAFGLDTEYSTRYRQPVLAPPGWYLDPGDARRQRYWDGATWTANVAPPDGS